MHCLRKPSLSIVTLSTLAILLLSGLVSATSLFERQSTTVPRGAFLTTYPVTGGNLQVYQSKTPHDTRQTDAVHIVTHGVDRNWGQYFTYLNDAFLSARSNGLAYATTNTLRVSVHFASTASRGVTSDQLAWTNDNNWCLGEGSSNSNTSSLTVYDDLVKKFSDKSNFPNVKIITFTGHGCGGIITQRYAAVGSVPTSIPVRFIVGNPSSMVYWTTDRSTTVDEDACPYYNSWHYGLDDFYIPYPAWNRDVTSTFRRYAGRDVRYLVSLDDTSTTNGDQLCEARLQGGAERQRRSQVYWKYIQLLTDNTKQVILNGPGDFDIEAVTGHTEFHGVKIQQKLHRLSSIGHEADAVIGSGVGQRSIFGA